MTEGPGRLCSPVDAQEAARRGVFGGDVRLRTAIAESEAGSPVLVERLDRQGAAYYLVPFRQGDRLRAVVEVDARTCEIAKAGAITGPGANFLVTPDRALAAARNVQPGIPDNVLPRLVWQPCRESFDSFYPLWAIPHTAGTVFVDQSGVVHERLHTQCKGGGAA